MADPAHSILEAASADDPDTEAARMLLFSLDEVFHGELFSARDVFQLFSTERGEVFEALHSILGRRVSLTGIMEPPLIGVMEPV
jgi:hypothetical protein